MSMRPVPLPGIPQGTPAMRLRDELGVVYQNTDFAAAFARRGAPAASPGVLALVSVLQYGVDTVVNTPSVCTAVGVHVRASRE